MSLIVHYDACMHADGVLGCESPNGTFIEESNFHISSVRMRVKIPGKEAGWIVNVSDVSEEDEK